MTTITEGAYRRALYDKLHEEVDELIVAIATNALIEEAADVLEVVPAIAAEHGVTRAAIDEAARRKREETEGSACGCGWTASTRTRRVSGCSAQEVLVPLIRGAAVACVVATDHQRSSVDPTHAARETDVNATA
ncbi:nucleoside triphosphate pyrophosphohydrolase [Mycobacterium seoulense]|uniref:nucleoside triphosphate pyrophosphohydrolase n=1 Tax=Mycobacterium seoulense TaxID=386911 RepID=UPI003CEC0A4D